MEEKRRRIKLLMHTCCAPCSIYCIDTLQKEGIEPILYWYNPNIHPYIEYKNRRDTLKEYAESINIKVIFEEEYGLDKFCKNVIGDLKNRCSNYCYRVRLEQTAKYAKENGFDAITTTLFVSPYQKHEELKLICEEICKKYGLEFSYRDFRVGFREGQAKARELGLYMQKYCGCIFSEESRYNDQIIAASKSAILHNKQTEKQIRLGWDIPNLELKPYKNGNQDEIQFIYNLKKEVYQKYIENVHEEWNEENQKKLFNKFMKKNSKNMELIYLKGEIIGFYNGREKDNNTFEIGNICIKTEYQNKGIGTAILKEILFENKGKEITLQCFKENPVIKLYERMGFCKVDENSTYVKMIKSRI